MAAVTITDAQAQALLTQWEAYPMDYPHMLMMLVDLGIVAGEPDSQILADIAGGPQVVSTDTSLNT